MKKIPRAFFPALFGRIYRNKPTAVASLSSTAAERYVPQELSQVPSCRVSGSPRPDDRQSSAITLPHQRDSLTNEFVPIAIPNTVARARTWILFGVQGARRTLNPTQVMINDQSTDYELFQGLKKFYRLHRGRLRLWFSIWRLENCEVVKVTRNILLPSQHALTRISFTERQSTV